MAARPRAEHEAGVAPERPELAALTDLGESVQVVITQLGGARCARLVLVGRKSGLEVAVDLDQVPGSADRRSGEVADALEVFAAETVDLVVEVGEARPTRRLRLAAGAVRLESRGDRRWYATTEGNLSVRPATSAELIADAGVFDVEHYRRQLPTLPADADPIQHYVAVGASQGLDPSAMFDTDYYRRHNPALRRQNPLAHYCRQGWRDLRNPSPQFDTWWYWYKHLDPADDAVNPLEHYEHVGKHERLSTRPDPFPSRRLGAGHRLDPGRPIRRICLFAGYDPDGLVDPYVVDYVRELSAHADVYYLADCELAESELAKLRPYTRGRWAERHGHYDFGSYARLIERIGWTEIEGYDELLLVNDSCYLLRSLDEVFDQMTTRACDWWGLQATKGLRQTRNDPSNQFREPIDMNTVRSCLIDAFERDYNYDFLIGSYFLAFRRPVYDDPEFRRYLASVTTQARKRDIVKRYEVGLTRWLIQHGHSFDTFVSRLFPFHPIFTRWYFCLVEEGFPLLKRYFLAENHYGVPQLGRWRELVRASVPAAPVDVFERNLVRVTDPDKLARSLSIGQSPPSDDDPVPADVLTPTEFIAADRVASKRADWWVFPTDPISGQLTGNVRALFDHVKDDRATRKIVLARSEDLTVDGTNVDVVSAGSPVGQHRLLRAGTILIPHDRDTDLGQPLAGELHNMVHVGDEVPLLRRGYAKIRSRRALDQIARDQAPLRAAICSSPIDALARTAASYPLTVHQMWTTGLPRHDLIVCPEADLAADLRTDLDRLRALVDGRTLVLMVSAAGDTAVTSGFPVGGEDLGCIIRDWAQANDVVLGIRSAWPDAGGRPDQLAGLPTIDLSAASFVHVELLLRLASALITDYSSAFVDFALTGRPMLSFVPDWDGLVVASGGAFYDLPTVFPGPVCRTTSDFRTELGGLLGRTADQTYELQRRLLVSHLDGHSTARAVDRLRELTTVHGIGTWNGERIAR